MNSIRFMQRVSQLAQSNTRQITQSAVRASGEVHPGYKKIKAIQEKFQVDNGLPVHLKGGPLDKFLYQLTMGLCLISIGVGAKLIYELSFPKKN
ncbi:cytochrome c oxidase subunit 7A, mitochondrial-like [Ctenocephalides felis]|uniref:cytochrome c oxidase subunit 7A, mitochondrial-like n=1 Tax=Ctenocephalides felis TaxID=7515 RepID=UPI000E6E3E22|nr:cytochrome c oxidase subunit 7A, mitochondrial-like [Ctenocephalides felis]